MLPPDAPIGGFVSGVVSDEFGDPLAGVDVRLWRLQYSRERYVAQATGLSRRTDDRGQFRLFYVTPGRYVLAAASDDPRVAPVFYPGVTELRGALPLIVGRKQEVPGVGIQFRRAYEARVFGFALTAAGDALRGTLMLQSRRRSGEVTLPTRRVTANADGTFEFLNVPPGEYALTTGPVTARAGAEFALQFVSVDGSYAPPITIRTAPTATISGRVAVEGDGVRPTVAIGIAVDPDYPFTSATLPVGADGTFVMHGLAGPVRFTMRNTAPGWWLKSVNIGGVNAAEEAVLFSGADSSRTDVDVILSSSAGDRSGRVINEREVAADDYRVVVFSTNRDRWFVGSQDVRIGAGPEFEDRFMVRSLPPGDYFAAAVDGIEGDADAGEWQNPDVLAALSTRAQRVTVGERQRAVADLRLIRWER